MKKQEEVSIYLEEGLYEKIAKLAEKDNRDFQNMVETVLKRWVEEEENPQVPNPIQPYRPYVGPFVYPNTDIRTDGPIIYRTPPGTVPDGRILTDPPNTCEGTTIGPNGAMFASTDNPNGTCVTNGEEVGDRGVEIIPCISPEFLKRWENNGDNKFPEDAANDDDSFSDLHPYHQKIILNYAERVVQADGDPTKDDYGPVVRPFDDVFSGREDKKE